jgi:hypothetical protein
MVLYSLGIPECVDKIVVIFFLFHYVAYRLEQGHWYESSIRTKRGKFEY